MAMTVISMGFLLLLVLGVPIGACLGVSAVITMFAFNLGT